MGTFGGGGADNLDFSAHTYEELRAAVYGLSEEAIRVAGNEWADLKHRLHERVGTLHVTVAKLEPLWDSPAGQQALDAFRSQRDWMTELARVAGINEAHMDDVQAARIEAVRQMRVLDAQPGGPVPPWSRSRPAPSPGPATGGWVEPATLDWRQPRAAEIARVVYGQLAVAAASLAAPPRSMDVMPGSPLGDDPATAGRRAHTTQIPTGSGERTRHGPDAGTPARYGVRPGRAGPQRPAGGRTPESLHAAAAGGTARLIGAESDRRMAGPGASGRLTGTGPGGSGLRRGGVIGGRVSSTATAGSAGVAQPPGRVLGGGRPLPGTPAHPATPGLAPPTGDGRDDRKGGRKPGYERADPETFIDKRPANTAGGQVAVPGETGGFSPLPGTLGSQRPTGVEPTTREAGPGLEGFPASLETFTRHDGVQFEVRSVRGGS